MAWHYVEFIRADTGKRIVVELSRIALLEQLPGPHAGRYALWVDTGDGIEEFHITARSAERFLDDDIDGEEN